MLGNLSGAGYTRNTGNTNRRIEFAMVYKIDQVPAANAAYSRERQGNKTQDQQRQNSRV